MTSNNATYLPFLAKLVGVRLVIGSEIKREHRLEESLLKDVTGGDPVNAKALYAAPVTFVPRFKLWLYGNYKPEVRGRDVGIWSRIRLIPLLINIRGSAFHDPYFFEHVLEPELPGILAWAVRGCLDCQQHGLPVPAAVAQATAGYRSEQDLFAEWLAISCVRGASCEESLTMLFTSYKRWCSDEGASAEGRTTFSQNLEDEGFQKARNSNNNVIFRGVELNKP